MRLLKWLLLGLLALLVAALVAAAVYAWRATPSHAGEAKVGGLGAAVAIERDAHGIPTIRAATMADAAFGLGFAHAQDRLWQLETHKRIGSGRLAEAFGAAALDNDRFLRALGVRRAAAAQWAAMQGERFGESRAVLTAYAAGINAFQREHLKARPPEMLILGVPVEDWTPTDSLAWAIMMAWDLGGNWSSELLRARLSLTLPKPRIDEVLPPYPGDAPLVATDYGALYRELKLGGALGGPLASSSIAPSSIDRLLAAAPPFSVESSIEGVGSNNWVVAGTHTTTGKPLLANDPHLKITTPALWYFARIEVTGEGGFKAAGATLPGLPGIVLGQNEHIAWGFTNTAPDVQDLYLERADAVIGRVEETIKVKGAADDKLVVRVTKHGPMISDAGGAAATIAGPASGLGIAMRWTALDADADPVAAGLAILRARSVDAFVEGVTRTWVAPMQNMVVADRAGNIGMVSPGRVPLRGPDNDLKGHVPAPGWDARYDWIGFVPAHETPRVVNPPRGWAASANQKIHGPEYPHFLTGDWAPPDRQQRIEQLLGAKARHSIDDMAAMQADTVSLAARRVLPWLAGAKSDHPLAAAAMAALQGFDGEMRADAAAPLIFNAWARQLARAVFTDELGGDEAFERVLGARSFRAALDGVLERNDVWWCDDKRTPGVAETCADRAGVALTRALDELQARYGADVARWRWGDAHVARMEHRPFTRVPVLSRLFELRVPTGGDVYTLNVGGVGLKPDPTTGELYLNDHAASLRAIYDLGDPAQSRFMLSTGQSGLPWSAQYRDLLGAWARVAYLPLWADAAAVPAASLRLVPAPR